MGFVFSNSISDNRHHTRITMLEDQEIKFNLNPEPLNTFNPENLEFSPGQQLRQVRESKKIGQDAVAQHLLIGKQIVDDIEKDDYSRIVAPVYVRGYLRSYAQFLQISSDSIMVAFDKLNWYKNRNINTDEIKVLFPIKDVEVEHHWGWIGYALAVILLVILALWWHSYRKGEINNDYANPQTAVNADSAVINSVTNDEHEKRNTVAITSDTDSQALPINSSDKADVGGLTDTKFAKVSKSGKSQAVNNRVPISISSSAAVTASDNTDDTSGILQKTLPATKIDDATGKSVNSKNNKVAVVSVKKIAKKLTDKKGGNAIVDVDSNNGATATINTTAAETIIPDGVQSDASLNTEGNN
jgi:cytoskeletal protein RodZ